MSPLRRAASAALLCALLPSLAGCTEGETEANAAAAAPAPGSAPAANAAAAAQPAAGPAKAAAGIALDGEGLRLVDAATGSTRLLAFGTPAAAATEAVTRSLGRPPNELSSNPECGAGTLEFAAWTGVIGLVFQEGEFVGWDDPATLTTMDGIGVGVTRAALAAARKIEIDPNSTLGTEFTSGGLSGLLSSAAPDAKVTDLWAGTICIFR
jgi:hypothetical protein